MNTQNKSQLSTIQSDIALKPYQKINELTGEVVNKYKYLEGHPRQYRFDAKEGVFNINGTEKLGRTLTFQPIAWRIFTDNILNMGTKNWAEIFFIDDKEANVAAARPCGWTAAVWTGKDTLASLMRQLDWTPS